MGQISCQPLVVGRLVNIRDIHGAVLRATNDSGRNAHVFHYVTDSKSA